MEPDFRYAMAAMGLVTKDLIVPNGKLHRFRVEGDKAGSKNGWYVLFSERLPAGAFGCWKRQIRKTWCAKADWEMSVSERVEFKRRMEETRAAREAQEQKRRMIARNRATAIWKAASSASESHPYLVRKAVRNHGLRLFKGMLVVPLRDRTGNLHSLQFIDDDGNKRFLTDGRKNGCYFAIGFPVKTICIAEGYATAASIHEATGLAVAIAFDAGNLEPVAQTLRAKFPEVEIILCADNDENTPGNPGLTKARKAAAAIGGLLAVPPLIGDFNDFLQGWRHEA